jgi:hypothetical protein
MRNNASNEVPHGWLFPLRPPSQFIMPVDVEHSLETMAIIWYTRVQIVVEAGELKRNGNYSSEENQ